MKKTVLFEPTLLAEVERDSPAVYENYCQTPFSKLEFADYGINGHQHARPDYDTFVIYNNL